MEYDINLVSLNQKQKVDVIKMFCLNSDVEFIDEKPSDVKRFTQINLKVDGKPITLHCILKNVTLPGWADRHEIKRIQISSLIDCDMHKNENDVYSMLLGFVYVGNEPLIVAWNPFRFTFHKSNRSCYVLNETLIDTLKEKNGIYRTIDSKKELIVCDKSHFKDLINIYIERNGLN